MQHTTTPPSNWPPAYWRKHAEAQERRLAQALGLVDALLDRAEADRLALRDLRDELEEGRQGMARVLASVEAPTPHPCLSCNLTKVKGPLCHLAAANTCPKGIQVKP